MSVLQTTATIKTTTVASGVNQNATNSSYGAIGVALRFAVPVKIKDFVVTPLSQINGAFNYYLYQNIATQDPAQDFDVDGTLDPYSVVYDQNNTQAVTATTFVRSQQFMYDYLQTLTFYPGYTYLFLFQATGSGQMQTSGNGTVRNPGIYYAYNNESFHQTPPYPISAWYGFWQTSTAIPNLDSTPTWQPTLYKDRFLGNWTFTLEYDTTAATTEPGPPTVGKNIQQFNITLPEAWRVKDGMEWELQYATSANNTVWTDWVTLGIYPIDQITVAHPNVDPNLYYRYRYQVRTRILQSQWSQAFWAGQPGAPAVGAVVGAGDIADGAVDTGALADHSVTPVKISNTITDDFTFPHDTYQRQTHVSDRIVFGDGTFMSTAASGSGTVSKFAVDLGTITAYTPLTVVHNLGTRDITVRVYNVNTNEFVEPDIMLDATSPTNKIVLTFGQNYASGTFRVVIFA